MVRTSALLLLSLALAACSASPEVAQVEVTALEFGYEPASIEVAAGMPVRVTLVNEGTLEHDLSVLEFPLERAGVPEESGGGHQMEMAVDPDLHLSALPGESGVLEFTPTRPGTYEFFCTVSGHREAGMSGTLVVLEP